MYYLNGLELWGLEHFLSLFLLFNDDENYVYISPSLSQQIHQIFLQIFLKDQYSFLSSLSSKLNPWKNKVSIHR